MPAVNSLITVRVRVVSKGLPVIALPPDVTSTEYLVAPATGFHVTVSSFTPAVARTPVTWFSSAAVTVAALADSTGRPSPLAFEAHTCTL